MQQSTSTTLTLTKDRFIKKLEVFESQELKYLVNDRQIQ